MAYAYQDHLEPQPATKLAKALGEPLVPVPERLEDRFHKWTSLWLITKCVKAVAAVIFFPITAIKLFYEPLVAFGHRSIVLVVLTCIGIAAMAGWLNMGLELLSFISPDLYWSVKGVLMDLFRRV